MFPLYVENTMALSFIVKMEEVHRKDFSDLSTQS